MGRFGGTGDASDRGTVLSGWSLALHGGAGVKSGRCYDRAAAVLEETARAGGRDLDGGASALQVVVEGVRRLEDSGAFVAGRGSAPGPSGHVELDATVMDGSDRRLGAVAALAGHANPILVAAKLLELGEVVLLAGPGAGRFASEHGLSPIPEPEQAWLQQPDGFDPEDLAEGHGTVGAVARDTAGRLAAATSTGGVYGVREGRVGDTGVPGAGTWADDAIAVSCTGQGEAFIRACAAWQLRARVVLGGETLETATRAVLADVTTLGGDGGLIVVDAAGDLHHGYTGVGMKRAWIRQGQPTRLGVFGAVLERPGV